MRLGLSRPGLSSACHANIGGGLLHAPSNAGRQGKQIEPEGGKAELQGSIKVVRKGGSGRLDQMTQSHCQVVAQ